MSNFSQSPLEASQPAELHASPQGIGYYIRTSEGFHALEPFNIQWEFGFNKLQGVRHADVSGGFTIVVHQLDWRPDHSHFFAQDLDIVNHDYTTRIQPKEIIQRGENIFELSFPNLKEGQLLVIRDAHNLFAIGIGSISDALLKVFNSTKAPSHAVVGNIKDAIKSFPENVLLQAMLTVWEQKASGDKANKAWETVLEKKKAFEEAEKRDSKLVLGGDMCHEIQYYLSLEENPANSVEAKALISAFEEFKNNAPEVASEPLPEKEKLASKITQYRTYGPSDMVVTTVEIGDEVLVRFKGLPNEADGVVYRHKKAIQNEATGAFILQSSEIQGENWNTMSYENDGWGGNRLFSYPPMIEQQVDLFIDENEVEDSPEKLYEDYLAKLN